MASTSQLDDFPDNGVQWGDLGQGKQYRHAGLSAEDVMKIVPNELYAGLGEEDMEEEEKTQRESIHEDIRGCEEEAQHRHND